MGRIIWYGYTGTLTAAGGNSDLIEITPADDKPCKLRYFMLSQHSEVGDAMEEALGLSVHRFTATVTGGSGGSTLTGATPDSADTAAGCTVKANNTTVATTSGSDQVFGNVGWNERGIWEFVPMEDRMCPKAKQGEVLLIRCDSTAADDLTIDILAAIEEE